MLAVLVSPRSGFCKQALFTETEVKIACEKHKLTVVKIVLHLHNCAVFKGCLGTATDISLRFKSFSDIFEEVEVSTSRLELEGSK